VAEHATLADGTVLQARTAGSSSTGLLRLAAQYLDEAVLETGKTTLDEADLCAISTLVRGVARLPS
jgi:hypothetical protein